ncbi:Transcription-repair coupling factor (Superfamily II helicase) [Bosea sp. LC85]|uniref:c-type cytochrome n=1 Tax=Bosea sp. LC85 TaxID=1502851 RepID=UPI0004E40B41|nr:c-type cytochrome [Bosea sp. LC85]KFC69396.1 Transcription-repair coupling factor (Superfamily II helicase) [Bosea sp. LC85]
MSLLARARSTSLWLLGSWRRLVAALAMLVALGLAGVFLFAWLGVYNVAASTGHFQLFDSFLRFGMENSVRARAPKDTLPRQEDDNLVRLGAGHFHAGCSYCHGAPGQPISPVAARMLPPPPDLSEKVGLWRDGELFWIVKHGLKYAGMPGWPVLERDDEVWALVAFLRRLPELDERGYRALAFGEVRIDPPSGREIATGESGEDAIGACARCHGAVEGPKSDLVPVLHGQPKAMLAGALRAFAAGTRESGIMQTAASDLSERQIEQLASFYAGLSSPPRHNPLPADGAAVDRGAALARHGVPSLGIPACLDCHGASALPSYPRLAGQPVRYLLGQLRAWRAGLNDRSPSGQVMAPIARRLSAEQAADVAAYFAAQPAASVSAGGLGR